MIKFVLLGAAAAALAGIGAAGAQPAPPSAPPGAMAMPDAGPMGEGGRHGQMHGGRHGRMMEMMRPVSKAARFEFSRGEAEVDIKCAEDEPMRACAEAAGMLLDKLATQPSR